MDTRFITPIQEAIVEALTMMAELQPQPGTPVIKENNQANGVVTGLIDMVGPTETGSIAISFSKPLAIEMTRRMLRMDINEVDEMVQDLVGEMANMTAGGAKSRLQTLGYDLDLTLPKVATGDGHLIEHSFNKAPTILLPFTTESGDFFVELCFKQ